MIPAASSVALAAVGCTLIAILALAAARAARAAGRGPASWIATIVAAVAAVAAAGVALAALLVAAFGSGPIVRLLVFAIVPLALEDILPLAQWFGRRLRGVAAAVPRPGAPYAAVDQGVPAGYWATEAALVFVILALLGIVVRSTFGPDLVLTCGIPVSVALPTLLRATLAPRLARARLADAIVRLSANDASVAAAGQGDRLAELRAWTANLAQSQGLPAPAVVLAPQSATYAASSGREIAVIVIDDTLFHAFQTTELQAVAAHEVAHLVRNERLRRALAEALLAVWYVGVMLVYAHVRGPLDGSSLVAWLLAYAYVQRAVDRWSVRRGEFSADLTAAEWLGDARPMIAALRTIARVRGVPLGRRLGRRPSFGERISALDTFRPSLR